MSDCKCLIKLEKIKSLASLGNRGSHNFRKDYINVAPNANELRSGLNKVLVNPGNNDYCELWQRRLYNCSQNGKIQKVRKNAVYAYEIVTSFSHDAENVLNFDPYEWAEENVKYLKELFGEENVISSILHMDESTPHMHTIIVPIDQNGKLNAKSFTGNRSFFYNMQDSYGKRMNEKFGLEKPEKYSKAKAEDLASFYREINKAANTVIPKREENEPVEVYVERINEFVQALMFQYVKEKEDHKKDVAHYKTMQYQNYQDFKEMYELYDVLMDKFHGDRNMVKSEMLTIATIEKELPRKTVYDLFNGLVNKIKQLKSKNIKNIISHKELDNYIHR